MQVYIQREKPYEEVRSGLCVTPSEMDYLRQQGKPISSLMLSSDNFNDGDTNPSFEVPLEMRRGIDIAQVWNEQKTAEKKLRSFKRYSEQKQKLQTQSGNVDS